MAEKHKWVTDDKGNKECSKCGSKINANIPENFHTSKYQERDAYGILERVNWYPRCFPIKSKILTNGEEKETS